MADTTDSKKNPFAALLDDDEDGAINVSSDNMRAKKNPNKGGNPKKQKKMTDRKAGYGSQPGFAKGGKGPKGQDNELIRSYSSLPEETYNDEEEDNVEPEPKSEYVPYDQYVGALVVGTTKAGRKVTENDNVIMPLKDTKDDDDEVVNHGKKGKKNKEHKKELGNVVEIATMDLKGPTLDREVQPRGTSNNGDRNNRRNFNDKNSGGRGRGNNNRDDRDGGKFSGRGRGNRDRDGGNFSGRGRGNRDREGGRGNRDREGGRGRGGREGGRGPYNKDRGSGKGRGVKISSEEEFPSLGKA